MKKDNRKNIINNKAFSLIELSIVLIIIGLLVAGVTGGKSLIESAKIRALANEIREYERAIWTFRAARDRFPGDVANLGNFGGYSNYEKNSSASAGFNNTSYYEYKKTDFAAPYNTNDVVLKAQNAPYIDMYTEGIIDFAPDKNNSIPYSKVLNNARIFNRHTGIATYYLHDSNDSDRTSYGDLGIIGQTKQAFEYDGIKDSPKLMLNFDKKIDDGNYRTGKIRGSCAYRGGDGRCGNSSRHSYQRAIDDNCLCDRIHYAL